MIAGTHCEIFSSDHRTFTIANADLLRAVRAVGDMTLVKSVRIGRFFSRNADDLHVLDNWWRKSSQPAKGRRPTSGHQIYFAQNSCLTALLSINLSLDFSDAGLILIGVTS